MSDLFLLCYNDRCPQRDTCARAQTLPDKHGQPTLPFPLSRKPDGGCGQYVELKGEEK